MSEPNTFGKVREQAFLIWQATTNRNCEGINDDIRGSFECKWQDRATLEKYEHISIFCSLGDWANNITDILKDNSCDDCSFFDHEHCLALFRYYTRLLLVTSEILSDFEDMIARVKQADSKTKTTRAFLSDEPISVDALLGFINTVCKHKVHNIHRCNHHLPIWFQDSQMNCPFTAPIEIGNLAFSQPDSILMPKLSDIIMTIVVCYNRLDDLFGKEADMFKSICDVYNANV